MLTGQIPTPISAPRTSPRMASFVVRRLNYPVRMDSAVIEYSGY